MPFRKLPKRTAEVDLTNGDLLNQDVELIVIAWNGNLIPWWLFPLIGAGSRGGTMVKVERLMMDQLGMEKHSGRIVVVKYKK